MNKLKMYLNYLIFLVCILVPKKKNRWVFGAWFGNRVSDNPLTLYQYVKQNMPDIDCIWICNDVEKAKETGVKAVKRNSFSAVWKCITAEVSVMNQGYFDLGDYNWVQRSFKVQLWHGVPWKKIGEDAKDLKSGFLHKISHFTYLLFSKYDLYIAPSDETRKVIKSAFLTKESQILSVGQPRNEMLMDEAYCRKARERLQSQLGDNKNIIVYMPTFRDNTKNSFSFFEIAEDLIPILIKNDAILLEKQHYVQYQRAGNSYESIDRIINVENCETQELLASADLLITDYSSCFFDYLLRDKPIIHFLYDYDNYKESDRGLYYDISFVAAGPVKMNKSELLLEIDAMLNGGDRNKNQRRIIKERFDTYEGENNSQLICNEIMKRIQ